MDSKKHFLKGRPWPLMFIPLLFACAIKTGFDGESKTELGGLSYVSCGDDQLPSYATQDLRRIFLVFGNINHDSLVEDPVGMRSRLEKAVHGKCVLLESLDSLELMDNEGYLGFKQALVDNRTPFSHLGDDEKCYRARGTVVLALKDSSIAGDFSFQNRKSYFEGNIMDWLAGICE